jgi:hypothetical protein
MLGYTLLADGSSDQALMPILDWLLARHGVVAFRGRRADLRGLRRPPKHLAGRISAALEMYPCDLLFIHRDAEGMPAEIRRSEILNALSELSDVNLPTICVVPVRMQEAWLLIEETAIRKAAGNPNGRELLAMPGLNKLERLPNPKETLHGLLREASGLSHRRRLKFLPQASAQRVPEFIEDFSPLLGLTAFEILDADVREIVRANAWHEVPATD